MTILQITTDTAGQSSVVPRLVKISCTDSLATITALNYLSGAQREGFTFYANDMFLITYGATPPVTTGLFTCTITSSGIQLVAFESIGNVTFPVTSGDFAVFDGTAGLIKDAGYAPSNAAKTVVAMANGATTSGNILIAADAAGTVGNGPVAGNKVLTSTIVTPDVGPNLVSFDITVGQAALASGGSVTLVTSSGSKQYKVRSLQLNSGGTNFSGGGGDRLGQVTDGTTVYSVIPAATMQALVNAQWGVTALPNPASAAINTSTAAGASLVFKYSGGTLDYTAGSLVISGILERVA